MNIQHPTSNIQRSSKLQAPSSKLIIAAMCLALGSGCTVVSANRVFPKLAWYWSKDAQEQRREDAITKANAKAAAERISNGGKP